MKKGFANSTKMDFMNLKNESTIRIILGRISQRISIGPMDSDVFDLSNTKHLRSNADWFSSQLEKFVTFGFFSGTFLRVHRLVPIFYCNLLPAGAKKQETKKIVKLQLL